MIHDFYHINPLFFLGQYMKIEYTLWWTNIAMENGYL